MPFPAMQTKTIDFQAGVKDSGDMEAGTKTVTATSKPASPDYSCVLDMPVPSDALLEVIRCFLRLDLTIDSLTEDQTLHCSIEVNGVEKLTESWTSTGGDKAVTDVTDVPLGEWNCGVFFWVTSGEATISVCRLRAGVGSIGSSDVVAVKLHVPNGALVSSFLQASRDPGGAYEVFCYEKPRSLTRRGASANGVVELSMSDAAVMEGFNEVLVWSGQAGEIASLDRAVFVMFFS